MLLEAASFLHLQSCSAEIHKFGHHGVLGTAGREERWEVLMGSNLAMASNLLAITLEQAWIFPFFFWKLSSKR